MQDALAQRSFLSVPEPDLEGAQLLLAHVVGFSHGLGEWKYSWEEWDLFWAAGKSNISKLGSLRIMGCFCASLGSPSRGIGSTAKSQGVSEP